MGIDFYFAGNQHIDCINLMKDLNANVLKSYANDKKELDIWYKNRHEGWTGNLFVDSGAFSVHKSGAHVDVDDYIKYLNEHHEDITLYIQLDHIPGVWGQPRTREMTLESCEKSWENFKYMYSRLAEPKKLCPVYHMGEPIDALERIVNSEYDFNCLCISCSKDIQSNQHFDWYIKCIDTIKKKRPDVKIHLLGVGKPLLHNHLNMTSMDSTTWIMVGVNGSIMTPYGVYCVSDHLKSSPDCLLNRTEAEIKKISDYCEKQGYSLEEASKDYKVRLKLNIKYLFDLSHSVTHTPSTIKRRTLF